MENVLKLSGRMVEVSTDGSESPDITIYGSMLEMSRSALAEVYRVHADLLAINHTDVLHFEGDEQFLLYRVHGRIAGLLSWREPKPGEWWMQLGYVRPEFRRCGIYKKMWQCLVDHARDQGDVLEIVGGTAYSNKAMQAVMESLGRVPESIIYKYSVR